MGQVRDNRMDAERVALKVLDMWLLETNVTKHI
jgi:hypothetical protein